MKPNRPVLRYFGGKWMLAPWIVSHLPAHRIYIEPYGGAASVLLRKPRSFAEVYNDIDDDLVNLFKVLRDPDLAAGLCLGLRLTPFSRREYQDCKVFTDDPVERARRLVVRSFQGHGPDACNITSRTGFRTDSFSSNRSAAKDWSTYPDSLQRIVARMDGVSIENRPALDLIRDLDRPDALHYIDPPYVWETRTKRRGAGGKPANGYLHEMTDADHAELLDLICEVKGMVVLSGYSSPLYEERLKGWQVVLRKALADGARERTEVIYLNPAASHGHGLFSPS